MKFKPRKRAGIIYSVKNEITGEYYVGATTDSMQQRKRDHESRADRGESYPFAQAIATYGKDAFIWEQTDTASNVDELAKKEVEHIKKLNSKKDGYNADIGGGIKKTIYKYNVSDGKLVDTYGTLESASDSIGADKKQISKACLSVNKVFGGYLWSYEYREPFVPEKDTRKKEVFQYRLDGQLLAKYVSVSEASKQTKCNISSIAKVCRGVRNQAGGFLWRYS